jgi:hypothetical protein
MPTRLHLLVVRTATVFSTLCLLATVALWATSFTRCDQLARRAAAMDDQYLTYRRTDVGSFEGRLLIHRESAKLRVSPFMRLTEAQRLAGLGENGYSWRTYPRAASDWRMPAGSLANRLGFAATEERTTNTLRWVISPSIGKDAISDDVRDVRNVIIPWWAVAAAFATLPALRLIGVARRVRKTPGGGGAAAASNVATTSAPLPPASPSAASPPTRTETQVAPRQSRPQGAMPTPAEDNLGMTRVREGGGGHAIRAAGAGRAKGMPTRPRTSRSFQIRHRPACGASAPTHFG